MKIQFASDIHIEFPENREYIVKSPLRPEGDILILNGDIVPFSEIDEHSDFFNYISDHFKITYWLPGNHEYYHSDLSEKPLTLNEKIRSNVILVNNITVVTNNKINLIFSTLWSRINPLRQYEMHLAYSDFRVIRNQGQVISIDDYNSMHAACRKFLETELGKPGEGTTVVITHHMPTFMNYPEEYRNSPLSEAFATELSGLIIDSEPEYWIFGHHHSNEGDFNIGKTRLLTNQVGYVMYNEQKGFNPGKYIEV